ncbi:hypothetical protein CF15_07060 [Pyrodictium occultum]|uniref:PPM-type phosphatase domain-containing protein n=1 Tax=Pyrodictium occultum TaxID=2309 RepID=A0A0V8RWZ0_PYROC|nr:protein phosphatase 2C domain-containing protein [Pyrodictium occultum]KSW12474.1 hypothetical protein CF15_07060 [Pyrodictium occultum]
MAWRAWVATANTVHYEDDASLWLHGGYGAIAVADGVSTSRGGGASLLAAWGFTAFCRAVLPGWRGSIAGAARRCLELLDEAAREASPRDADTAAEAKRLYYRGCGAPCTRPMSPWEPARLEAQAPQEGGGGQAPSTTLLAALLGPGGQLALVLAGDGVVVATTGSKESTWLLWGALPQFYEGSRLARFIEVGRGLQGEPVVLETRLPGDTLLALATDGVDPAALAEELVELARRGVPEDAAEGNPASLLLSRIQQRAGGLEDDATIALAYWASQAPGRLGR